MQTRWQTVVEVSTGTAIGMLGSWAITVVVFSNSSAPIATVAIINTAACTVWSLVRGYSLRRYFNSRNGK